MAWLGVTKREPKAEDGQLLLQEVQLANSRDLTTGTLTSGFRVNPPMFFSIS